MGAFSPPWLKTLIFPMDSWWFWRPPAPQKAENHIFSAFYAKERETAELWYFTIKTRFFVISAIPSPGGLQNHQESLGNINVFNHGGVKASISPKSCELHGISWNSSKFHEVPSISCNFFIFCDFHDFCGFHDFWVPRGQGSGPLLPHFDG